MPASVRSDSVTALGIIAPPPIRVTTPTFDGSLANLFQCVRERRIELRDVPLLPICEAYFEYLLASPTIHLEEAAAALTALAYLLERKAWAILLSWEQAEIGIEGALELPEPTVNEFDVAIEALVQWQQERSRQFFRTTGGGPDPYEVPYVLDEVALPDLARAFERLLARASPEPIESLARPRKSLAEGMAAVLLALSATPRRLEDLLRPPYTRSDAVLWFLALLELIRLGRVLVTTLDGEALFAQA